MCKSAILVLAVGLMVAATGTLGETVHSGANIRASIEVLSDPRLPITFGSLSGADTPPQPTVRIPQPRHR